MVKGDSRIAHVVWCGYQAYVCRLRARHGERFLRVHCRYVIFEWRVSLVNKARETLLTVERRRMGLIRCRLSERAVSDGYAQAVPVIEVQIAPAEALYLAGTQE
jgi:hypothetical protein